MVKCMLDGAFVALGGPHNLKAEYYHSPPIPPPEYITTEEEVDEVGRKCKVVDDLLDEYGIPRLKILYIPSLDWTDRSNQLIQDVIERYLEALHEDYNGYSGYGPKVLCVVQDPDYWPGSELEDPLVLQRRAAKEKEYNDNPYSKCKPDHKKVSLHHLFGSHYRAKFLVRGQPSFTRHGKKPYGYSAFRSHVQNPSKIMSNPQKLFKEKSYWEEVDKKYEEEDKKMKLKEESEWEQDRGLKIEVQVTWEEMERMAMMSWGDMEEMEEKDDRSWEKEMELRMMEESEEEEEEEEKEEEEDKKCEEEDKKMKVKEELEWEQDRGLKIEVQGTWEEVDRMAMMTWGDMEEKDDRSWEKEMELRMMEESEVEKKMEMEEQLQSAQPSSSKISRPDSAEYFFFGSPIPKKRRFLATGCANVDERKSCLSSQPCGGEKEERTSKCPTISPQEEN